MRVCLAFRAQSEFLDEPGFVERAITSTFERVAAGLQTRKPREMRTEKLTSVELTRRHSLQWSPELFGDALRLVDTFCYKGNALFTKGNCHRG